MTLKNAASDANDVFLCTSILAVVSRLKAVIRYVNYSTYNTTLSEPLNMHSLCVFDRKRHRLPTMPQMLPDHNVQLIITHNYAYMIASNVVEITEITQSSMTNSTVLFCSIILLVNWPKDVHKFKARSIYDIVRMIYNDFITSIR